MIECGLCKAGGSFYGGPYTAYVASNGHPGWSCRYHLRVVPNMWLALPEQWRYLLTQ